VTQDFPVVADMRQLLHFVNNAAGLQNMIERHIEIGLWTAMAFCQEVQRHIPAGSIMGGVDSNCTEVTTFEEDLRSLCL
jgi:hypothetical protein